MKNRITFPTYHKFTMILLSIVLLSAILYTLSSILIPLSFGFIFAILLNPLVNKFTQWGVPRIPSIFIVVILAFIVVGGLMTFIYYQFLGFYEMRDVFMERLLTIYNDIQVWLKDSFGIGLEKQNQAVLEFLESTKSYAGQVITNLFTFLGNVFLVIVFIIMFLIYKSLFVNFCFDVFNSKHKENIEKILDESKQAIQSYVEGLGIEMIIMGILNSTAYLIMGIEYAILIGVLGAIVNLIPYIGGIIGVSLPIFMYLVMNEVNLFMPIVIIAVYSSLQMLDNYVIVPKVVAGKVSVNAFFTVFGVLLGGALWGVSGMFLSIIFLGILKIVFEKIEGLKPYAKIIGDKK
ncbi:AI-2E family transporter [Weeksellaceae bacterium TAE3-ERU29]|nr:AI-2E family transporter [Weeksellaceae bacterium TAE3-ERU29]